MNLFRSEEHVRRWSLYDPASADYIMALTDWVQVFSGPMHRRRLDPDFLARSAEYLAAYHADLKALGKSTSFWMIPFIRELQTVGLSRYRVAGSYTRFEAPVLNTLKDARIRIRAALDSAGARRNNHLIWAPPGSGKTFFVQQVAGEMGDRAVYHEVNLARLNEAEFRRTLHEVSSSTGAALVLIDEVDARGGERWPYEALLPLLDIGLETGRPLVVVLAGSASFSLEGMKQEMAVRTKGKDVLSRIPGSNEVVIPSMSFGDRVLVMLSQFRAAGREAGRDVQAVEKLGLYYAAVNPRLANVRQLREFAVRAAERIPPGDDRVKYDSLFEPGDPANKRFWQEAGSMALDLIGNYVLIED